MPNLRGHAEFGTVCRDSTPNLARHANSARATPKFGTAQIRHGMSTKTLSSCAAEFGTGSFPNSARHAVRFGDSGSSVCILCENWVLRVWMPGWVLVWEASETVKHQVTSYSASPGVMGLLVWRCVPRTPTTSRMASPRAHLAWSRNNLAALAWQRFYTCL